MDALVKAGVVFFGAVALLNMVETWALGKPDKAVKEIYNETVVEFKKHYNLISAPKLIQSECDGVLAKYYPHRNAICISNHMATYDIKKKSVMQFAIAHELAHAYLRHDYGDLGREEHADMMARNVIFNIKDYNKQQLKDWLLMYDSIDDGTQTGHPSWYNRARLISGEITKYPIESWRKKRK